MKIALCSKGKFSLEKGSTKNRIELAEGLQKLGWQTVLIDRAKMGIPLEAEIKASQYNLLLKDYLVQNSHNYDVVLYEYDTLPFDRSNFSKSTLFVARPALLAYHLQLINFKVDLKTKISSSIRKAVGLVKGDHKKSKAYLQQIAYSLSQADLIQVQNRKDKDLLIERGFNPNKIVIIPNGISSNRLSAFNYGSRRFEEPYTVAFVGTFDFRKGAMDFAPFLSRLVKQYPSVKLKLLGTRGLFYSIEQVLNFFPKHLQDSVEVIPVFNASDLPALLSDCQIGIFPSYLESFGFGALEMMCAGLPVVAYDAPGPCDFILPELLVRTGDSKAMAQKVMELLGNKKMLEQKSKQAREMVLTNYCWDDIAKKVEANYKAYLLKLQVVSAFE